MAGSVKVTTEAVTFKTYLTGAQDQHPIFLEHRVYQGSSGAVYPYGVTDTLLDKSEDRSYQAMILENDYLKIMILPELGGRVHRAYDKINKRDFVYFNHVVKPALVGLLGPWISGGIEFNWPQHHRPTTFMGVDHTSRVNADGSATVIVGEREPMHGLSIATEFTLFPDKALLQIKSRVYNGNDTPRSFLWWSNPAVKGGDDHQSIFPPDVTAVYDHGKRAVIDFPIAHGEYYKVKYDGVDISRYRNLPVPTSYMAWKSNYNFVGAYSHDEQGGLLHVADHHVSRGKKQWTWGNGDFGQAWDRNLTDSDGPYIELMTGVYTDNQPDFTWLDAGEEKEFVQNFLPYSKLGRVHNANTRAALKLERTDAEQGVVNSKNPLLHLGVYAIEAIKGKAVLHTEQGKVLAEREINLTPCCADTWDVALSDSDAQERLVLSLEVEGKSILDYIEHIAEPTPLPSVAPNPPMPKDVQSADEAYFIGQHLEQYHHATRNNYEYYQRGLEIDPLDYRCNLALGNYEYNRCNYAQALKYADQALKRAHMLNRNPDCGLASVLRGNCLVKLGQKDEAYDEYYAATWSYNARTKGYLGASFIAAQRHDYADAYYLAGRALQTEATNQDALAQQCFAAYEGHMSNALELLKAGSEQYPLNPVFAYFKAHYAGADAALKAEGEQALEQLLPQREINFISIIEFLVKNDRLDLVLGFLNHHRPYGAIANLMFAALVQRAQKAGLDSAGGLPLPSVNEISAEAVKQFPSFVRFPNLVCERDLLGELTDCAFALHLSASFDYAHRLYEQAASLWQKCLQLDASFVEAYRGLGIYTYNKQHDSAKAISYFAQALEHAPHDERLLFEHDLLLKLTGHTPEERLSILEQHGVSAQNCVRDDLKAELVTLYNQLNRLDDAHKLLQDRVFHVWEGGEGRVTGQYIVNATLRAHQAAAEGKYQEALDTVLSALTFPHNLGEGKLVVQTDNDLYFLAAYYAQKAGADQAQVQDYLNKAQQGDTTISEQHYYNDLPLDYVFYHGLAQAVSGDVQGAKQLFEAMKKWSYDAFDQEVQEDFFAVSLPDLVVLDSNLVTARHENCLLMRLLAAIGLNDQDLYQSTLQQLSQLSPSNFKVHLYHELSPVLMQIAAAQKL
ncbi:MAG TPA: DUF5107 domain-containing protein [Candidatus Anaerobiospirillum pullistercoris]|uniref:DUF5107 domain-containing protein n=1 Tax=Candidatus Anaerobiospirillum pullistercoris TaxID=2838452 RepID=A0A9D2B1L2_9GAMM|nr:DUF5107 domain-containing protein [Candidatus Anaerobiospirillum pullistercoris]